MKAISSIFLLLFVVSVSGQINSKLLCLVGGCEEEIDTVNIDNIHRYNGGLDFLTLGNSGLSGYNLLFKISDYSDFYWSKSIGNKKYTPKIFNVKRPYTKVSYLLGSKEEQVLSLLHTQNISKQANFSIGFDKVKSKGFYVNQATNNNHLFVNSWYKTKNEKYKISLNFDSKRIFNETNGGIVTDSLFEQDLSLNRNRELLNVTLSLASFTTKRNRLNLNQTYTFYQSIDSLNNGISHRLILNVEGNQNQRVYKDSSLNFSYYNQILIDSVLTNDVVKFENSQATFGYQFHQKKDSREILIYPFAKVEIANYRQGLINTNYTNLSAGFNFSILQKKINFLANMEYFIQGYRSKNINLEASLSYQLFENWEGTVRASFKSVSPALDVLNYAGNSVFWANSFTTATFLNFSGELSSKKYKTSVKVSYNDILNPVFFNFLGKPQQIDGVTQIIQFSAQKEFQLNKWIFKPRGVYQYNGGYDIYRLPEYYADLTIGFKTSMYKNNLHLFIGLDVVYYAPIKLMGYNPMVDQFYLEDTKTAGNYPFVDVFLNARIKTVRFFLKATHANSGLLGFNYYGAKGYPLKDRSIQFGLNWTFIN